MLHFRLAIAWVLVSVGALMMPPRSEAQKPVEPDKKQQEAIQRIQKLLDEVRIETKDFQKEMPLVRFLEAVEKQIPKDKKLSLRVDKKAFGDKYDDVAATPVVLRKGPKTMNLTWVLLDVICNSKTKIDYRVGINEVTITTPALALYTATHDIRELIEKPEALLAALAGHWTRGVPRPDAIAEVLRVRDADPAQRVPAVIKWLISGTDCFNKCGIVLNEDAVQVLNGTRLVIRGNAATHAEIARLLGMLRGDMSVIVQTKLYEVDEKFYKRVVNAKRLSLEDLDKMEQEFLEGAPDKKPRVSLHDLLAKQKLIQEGDKVTVDNGQRAALLSSHQIVTCLPSPEQLAKGDEARQVVLEGVSFSAEIRASDD